MKKKLGYPSRSQVSEAVKRLKKSPVSYVLPEHADAVVRLKFSICEQMVIYGIKSNLTQRALAHQLNIDEALMSKVLHYHVQSFTVDRLLSFLLRLTPGVSVEIKHAA